MLTQYTRLRELLIHPKLKQDQESYNKALFGVDFSAITFLTLLGYGLIYIYIGWSDGLYVALVGLVFVIVFTWHFTIYGSFLVLAWGGMLINFIIISALCLRSGGVYSVASPFYTLGVVIAFIFGSQRIGIYWSLFIVIWLAIAAPLLQNFLGDPLFTFPKAYHDTFILFANVGVIVFFALFAFFFEAGRRMLWDKVKVSQKQVVESEKMASLGQLTAGIAHEINNPVNFVNGSTEAIRADLEEIKPLLTKLIQLKKTGHSSDLMNEIVAINKGIDLEVIFEEIEELMNGVQEGGDRISHIVSSLRTFSHESIETVSTVDIEELIEATLVILNSKLNNKHIHIVRQFAPLPLVNCKAGKINQVFINIIDNAIFAMSDGGQLTLITAQENNEVHITIGDNGAGIDLSIMQRIFDPFFTTKEVGKGTGLGLSISYGIIQEHQGKISFDSQPEEGTICTIVLPIN